jgi:beta-lactamase regulating signal transducer with metallopeptidase domain
MLLGFSSLMIATFGSALMMRMLNTIHEWSWRRTIQLLVLVMPPMAVGLGFSLLHYLLLRLCALLSASPLALLDSAFPTWLDSALPISISLIALGAICFGIIRLLLLARMIRRSGAYHHTELQQYANDLAQRLGTVQPRVLLCFYDRPLAFTYGVLHPTILLSTWMVKQLDQHELDAVLAHELEHVARFDYLIILLATVLRDAFFYLPTSRKAYRQLQQEKELVCDDLAVRATKRPLALASALTKVWLHRIDTPACAVFGGVQPLAKEKTLTDHRIERLLDMPPLGRTQPSRIRILGTSISIVLAFALVQSISSVLLLAVMC